MIDVARRSVAIGTVVAAVLVLSAPLAAATEVDDVLERARSATYTATRLTVSVWADQTNVTRERVEHAAGAEMVRVDETWSMVGNGRTVVMGDAPEGIAFMTKGASVSTERYAIGEEAPCRHLRRRGRAILRSAHQCWRSRSVRSSRSSRVQNGYTARRNRRE